MNLKEIPTKEIVYVANFKNDDELKTVLKKNKISLSSEQDIIKAVYYVRKNSIYFYENKSVMKQEELPEELIKQLGLTGKIYRNVEKQESVLIAKIKLTKNKSLLKDLGFKQHPRPKLDAKIKKIA